MSVNSPVVVLAVVSALSLGACATSDYGHRGHHRYDGSWRDRDDNPPGPAGGRGTNWENPPGPRGGPGASPDRPY